MTEAAAPLLSVQDFRLEFDTFDGVYQAIDGIGFDLAPASPSASSARPAAASR